MKRATMVAAIVLIIVATYPRVWAQRDPGPRPGSAGAGNALTGLSPAELDLFTEGMKSFMEVDSVSGTVSGEDGKGLGPAFNGNSCTQCHSQPAIGASSPGLSSPQNSIPNPQVLLASLDGASNTVPSFINANGPVREARFIRVSNQKGAPLDGRVHALFTIAGRSDAAGCTLAQPDFATELANHNVSFRIPTPTFGLGLVEATLDSVLRSNLNANASLKARLGIGGSLNTTGNDGTVTRFGWKAQNKSLLIFAGEAYNVEQGVSNEVFENERSSACITAASPEDATKLLSETGNSVGTAGEMSSDVVGFANFMRLSAPAVPIALTTSAQNGAARFSAVGCDLCHSSTLTTGPSRFTGMSSITYHPYSDFALHHMGAGLSDGVRQGAAGPDEFRTAPLWGAGQRLFFLHDGRTSNLIQAIRSHSSSGSEANGVIDKFNSLSSSHVQDMLNFLRSL